jgi:8-hydroxy-5-deazaflavin:NADPH oxidoreductase
MKIAVFGTGIVGQVIASRLAGLNHEVTVGTRNVDDTLSRKEKDHYGNEPFSVWYNDQKGAIRLGKYEEAASLSEIIINCTNGQTSIDALKQGGDLSGKILIDVANPLESLNTMNCYVMVNPDVIPGDHSVFVSGNDAEAKSTTKELLKSFGWKEKNIFDLGDITTARGTEQLLPIWIRLWSALQNPMFNFNIVIGPAPHA